MPLKNTCSISAFEASIATEIRAGKPREQAVAIAHRTLREACREEGKPVPTRKALDVIRKQQTTEIQTLILPKDKFKSREAAAAWAKEHDFLTTNIRETEDSWRIQQRPAKDFQEGSFSTIDIEEGIKAVIGRPMEKVQKRERTREFLESAFDRARKILNPRDFAVIFQAARSSAGGQISAKRRRERREYSAAEKQLVEKAGLRDMSKAELRDLSSTLSKAYSSSKKGGRDLSGALSRAASLRAEFRRRELGDPEGPVYVELKKRGKKEVRKGFVNGQPEGGMHAHGLDRRNSKTLGDGGHLHAWQVPGTGDLIISHEDGFHQHEIIGDTTTKDGAHSHHVVMPNGTMLETKLGGNHPHTLMVETSGLDGPHTHGLVLPDGAEITSLTIGRFLELLSEPPPGHMLPSASEVVSALLNLRIRQENEVAGAALPPVLPDLSDAVELTIKGESIAPPTFTMEVVNSDDYPGYDVGDMLDVRHDGEIVGFSKHVVPDDLETVTKTMDDWQLIERHTTPVPFVGSEDARLMFVSAAPNELELARKQALVGDDAITFRDVYLRPLGLSPSDVAMGFAMPVLPRDEINPALCDKWSNHLVGAMKTYRNAKVVALGRVARDVLKGAGIEFWSLPHPSAVRKRGDSGEVARKLKTIAKALDVTSPVVQNNSQRKSGPSKGQASGNLADAISEMRKTGHARCRVIKSAEDLQIVYGVVLDPYDVDLQTEWVPPAEIESTSHGFMKKSRVIGFEHVERAEAQIVESWVVAYPSREDYLAARENRPHRAFVRKFGDDDIHSGAWIAGVELGDREWALYKQGKLNAFSVGGFSFKTKLTTAAMPEVEFIRLVESAA